MKGAVADCDRAVAVSGDPDRTSQRRAPVLLRAGENARALNDYDAMLRETKRWGLPLDPYALFGRGIARARLGDATGAEADLKTARASAPSIDAEFLAIGLKP
jgi:regulator of sirC expression with transglutaminase-like and TPR domain